MKRRAFLLTTLAAGSLAFVRPEVLPVRRAQFEEVGNSILMTMSMPELLSKEEEEVMTSIDSGFVTTLRYEMFLFRLRAARPLQAHRRVVKIQYDLWKKRYIVTTRDDGGGAAKRYFTDRSQALEHAVTLRRVPVATAGELRRGGKDGPFSVVSVTGMRNPLDPEDADVVVWGRDGRGQGRDVRWFARLVHALAGDRPVAEQVISVRSNPFYLVNR